MTRWNWDDGNQTNVRRRKPTKSSSSPPGDLPDTDSPGGGIKLLALDIKLSVWQHAATMNACESQNPLRCAASKPAARQRVVSCHLPGHQMLSIVPALVCLLVLTANADVSKEATWSVTSGGNGHTYRVVAKSSLISWDSANAAAAAAGGYLATITSAAENAFVFSLIDDPAYWTQSINDHGPWIGGYQPAGSSEPDGGWRWVTRTGVTAPEAFSFTNWESGEPNNQTATVNGVTYNADRIGFFHTGTGRAATWSDEYNLTGSPLNQWTISYVIEFSGTPPILTNPRRLTDGSFQFAFTNRAGAFFEVLATTNLALPLSNWTLLGSVTELSSGQFQFTDSQATNLFRRFYRVRPP